MERLPELFARLKTMTLIPATSGFEQGVAACLREEMRPLADRVEVDRFGNVYGYLDGDSAGPRVMIPAHSDSVGMIVSHIEENGYLRFDAIGAVPPNLAYAQRVLVVTPQGPRMGVVGSKPGHIASAKRRWGPRSRRWMPSSSMSAPHPAPRRSGWGSSGGSR